MTGKQAIQQAFAVCLTPVVRMFLRVGASYSEFSELAKRIFVDVAAQDHGERGRPANVARISAATGISRREVSRLRKCADRDSNWPNCVLSKPARVLLLWAQDGDYRGGNGAPIEIPLEGARSLADLVSRVSGDVPIGAVKAELLRAGCIELSDAGLLRLKSTMYLEPSMLDRLTWAVSNQLRFHAETILYNTEAKHQCSLRREKMVFSNNVLNEDLVRFRKITYRAVDQFVDNYNATVSAYDQWSHCYEDDPASRTCGVGIFYFENSESDTDGR